MAEYERMLDEAFEGEGVAKNHRDDIRAYLQILKNRDQKTYEHSVRVGVLASKIAIYAAKPGISARMMLWAGLLHDIGKALVPPEILTKTSSFTQDDHAAMEPHVKYGWDMLVSVHDWTAQIIVRHHQFGPHPYPATLPPLPEYMTQTVRLHGEAQRGGVPAPSDCISTKAEMIQTAARLLAMADYYDALMNRDNDRNGQKSITPSQRREIYMRDNADQKELAELLESVGVLKL